MSTTIPSKPRWQVLGSLPVAVALLVAINALYIVLVAVGNITDYDTNYAFVQHVLSMDTTNFGGTPGDDLDPHIMWRAITDPVIWNISYIGVIVWESITGLVLIGGLVLWVRGFARGDYRAARALSSIGLLMIILLFFGGFITVGGEWFSMWRSTSWNGLDPAFRNAVLAAINLVLIHVPVAGWGRRRDVAEAGAASE